jgi:hypothetical protein
MMLSVFDIAGGIVRALHANRNDLEGGCPGVRNGLAATPAVAARVAAIALITGASARQKRGEP